MSAKNATASAATSAFEREVVITRIFDAPRELVFKAWTEPERLMRWWGPRGFTNPVCETDVRPGGAWRIVMRAPNGAEYPGGGVYLEQLARGSKLIPEPFRLALQGTPWEGTVLAQLRELSPLRHVRSGMPPFLLIHGTADALVPFDQSQTMCRAIRKAGGEFDLLAVKGGGHGLRGWESAGLVSYKRLMIGWLNRRVA
jgi:acetyl esterase/lipase